MLISMILARIPSQKYIEDAITQSVSKELSVMESTPRSITVNWEVLFESSSRHMKMADECMPNHRINSKIHSAFRHFRNHMDLKLLWPHSTMRGISENSALVFLGETHGMSKPWYREEEDSGRPVSSRDVVANFLHNGFWITGDCELKQRWYPSGLTPRTYFAQGGDAIRVSCYLRDFFNELCDQFIPTERRARVDGSRLVTYADGYFFIYDLTSFTSNFHEQLSFLTHLANFFRGTTVLCVSEGLSLIPFDLGEMIDEYSDVINTKPRYRLNTKLFSDDEMDTLVLLHNVAGFLGVPGNLATCTLAHGTLIAQHTDTTDRQSCAGDDGNIACKDKDHETRIKQSISRLGIFQEEKGSTTEFQQAASYLKRRFLQNGRCGSLVRRVEFVLLSVVNAYRKPDPRFPSLSLEPKKVRESIAKSVCSFFRSCFEYTNGVLSDEELEVLLDFLRFIYEHIDLPKGGEVRGMLGDEADISRCVDGVVVFPLERDFFLYDPDQLLVERFMPWVVCVPEQTKVVCSDFSGDWFIGETRSCQMSGTLEKLVKYGWIDRKQPRSRVLVGPDARKFFRRLLREEIQELEYEYTARIDLPFNILERLGLNDPGIRTDDKRVLLAFRKRQREYVDLDDPYDLNDSENMSSRVRIETVEYSTGALGIAEMDY